MPIQFACEHCSQRLRVASQKAGTRAKCPKCRQPITVPQAAPEPAASKPSASRANTPDPPLAAKADVPDRPPAAEPDESDAYAQFAVFDHDPAVAWVYESQPLASRTAREPVSVDHDKLAVSRRILYLQGILLAVVAFGGFFLGVFVGSRGGPERAAEDELPQPCRIAGRITYVEGNNRSAPDEGAVVVVLPQEARPDEKIGIEGLRPGDPSPQPPHPGLTAINLLGGAYVRADADGQFALQVPDRGKYFLLVISQQRQRRANQELSKADLAQLGRYFLPAPELLGQQQYQWRDESVRGELTRNIVFE